MKSSLVFLFSFWQDNMATKARDGRAEQSRAEQRRAEQSDELCSLLNR